MVPDAVLEIAGSNHPSTPGYLESLQTSLQGSTSIRFLGYVPEIEVKNIFQRARLIVLPYTSAAGTSGVVHQACQHGLPIVATEIAEFTEMAREEGIAMVFYSQGNPRELATRVIGLLTSERLCSQMSTQNRHAAAGTPMSEVVAAYLRLFRTRIAR